MYVTLIIVKGITITAEVGAILECSHLMESGEVRQREKVISGLMEVVSITAMEQLDLEKEEVSNTLTVW